ncbi:ATP-grasp domain-containing protein [Amphibacillus sp. MSJ-3]|uniref:ATP-grasp domain-containing protein n=1 Tax=Amphibacillus sp. MSJ-3 TaxID=2841505 RepID=UPI001C0F0E73|nr:ATP-grasp domain-containing protein [Amphibacillus sp. MSJ-3]MBU5594371.1 ATP-grasp domain-containing protein [Amphibacillus sp. MSJ-3]
MLTNNFVWLPYLNGAIPEEAMKKRMSMYTIALEAWRRGISLSFYQKIEDGKKQYDYKLTYGDKTHYFQGSMGDLITPEAVTICGDKSLTYQYLEQAGVPIPQGKTFNQSHADHEIIEYARQLTYPLVLKPTDGSGGKGVFANIQTETELSHAIKMVRGKLGCQEVILQQHIEGKEVRIYVFKDKVLSAINRVPGNVIGDGEQTIRELLKEKNELRKISPHLYYQPMRINAELYRNLKEQNCTLETIPPKGQQIYLRKTSNISTGGDPIDYTDKLSDQLKEIAVKARQAIPGLLHSGIDMIIDEENNRGVIIELNTRPGLGFHLFPLEGRAVDVPKYMIDYYFPETKYHKRKHTNIYFNLKSAFASLEHDSLAEVEIKDSPENELIGKCIQLTFKYHSRNKIKKIQQLALTNNLNGWLDKKSRRNIDLVIAVEDEDKLNHFIKALEGAFGKKIIDLKVEEYSQPIQMGFEIKGSPRDQRPEIIAFDLSELEKNMNALRRTASGHKRRIKAMLDKAVKGLKTPFQRVLSK